MLVLAAWKADVSAIAPARAVTGDFDGDGRKELWVFARSGDALCFRVTSSLFDHLVACD